MLRPGQALALQRSAGNRATCAAMAQIARKPPKVKSKTTYTHTSAELFAPGLDNYGRFTGAELLEEEAAIRQSGVTFDGDIRIDMLIPRLVQADKRRAEASVGGAEVLAVFLAPEWYFKRTPVPYSADERDRILSRLQMVSSAFPHMLIVPGSIIWRDAGGPKREAEIGHLAPVFFGGRLVLEHEKWQNLGDTIGYAQPGESDDHAMESRMLPEHGGAARPGTAVKQANLEYGRHRPKRPEKAGTSFFQISNVRFSIEVCGDHGRAAREAATKKPWPTGPDAHVQLLVAHGASLSVGHATVPTGGYQYGVNAATNPGMETGQSLVQKIDPVAPSKPFESINQKLFKGTAMLGDPRLMHGGVHALV